MAGVAVSKATGHSWVRSPDTAWPRELLQTSRLCREAGQAEASLLGFLKTSQMVSVKHQAGAWGVTVLC